MQMMHLLQALIHKTETGRGLRYVKFILLAMAVVVVLGVYNLRCYRNMSAPEAMDSAQLARNISRGRGFTTGFVRPLSIHLIRDMHTDASDKDPARLNSGHPDIANAPVYPSVLAGLMKVLPFKFEVGLKSSFWSIADPGAPGGRRGIRYQPDFLITLFNQTLFIAVIVLVFFWARWLFDAAVAWTSAFLLLGTELLWRFSISGLSTMLLVLVFVLLIWCLTLCEREAREPKWGQSTLVILSLTAGVLTGIGGLTRYSFMWIIIPVALFLALFGGPRRMLLCAGALVAFACVMAPWIIRNYTVSGTPFGIAGYAVTESALQEFKLQRSLQPEIGQFRLGAYGWKLVNNLVPVLRTDLFSMAGGWISALFLVSLMVGFRNVALRRVRYFVVACVATLAIAQALIRTQLSDETPEINSENLLVLLTPVVLVFGVGLFYQLLDVINVPFFQMRYVVIGLFALVLWLPMLFAVLSSRTNPVAYPPYRPDIIESSSRVMGENDLMMSDMPWAVAWYGDRQCVWLTWNATASLQNPREWQESFFAINDALKPIHALYLTPRTLDARFQTQWVRAGQLSWGTFVIETMLNRNVPAMFPLRKMPPGYWPEQLLLWDWSR